MIKSLAMPASTVGENPLRFPVPKDGGPGTITVLCGPNGSGKSYILRMLKDMLEGKAAAGFNRGRSWELDATGTARIVSHRPHHHKSQMTSIGMLSAGRAGKVLSHNDDDLRVQIEILGMLIQALDLPGFAIAQWQADPTYRAKTVLGIGPNDEERIYWLGRDIPEFARLFELAFDCRLGMRRAKDGLELVLGQANAVTAPFANWSDGQKSYFTVLATTSTIKPEVYIFDEIENFMHPELISRTIEHLKRNCRQTVLSSHHPHLIFGRAIDAVFYVETLPPSRPAFAERILKYQRQPSAPRRITKLETDRAKLASAYRLFDVRDAALLATAAHVREAVDFHLNDAVRALFECVPAPASRSLSMDRQTEEIAGFIQSFSPEPRRILDWGAGLGRSFAELSKEAQNPDCEPFSWLLYEPDLEARTVLLRRAVAGSVDIVGTREQLASVQAGLVLLTNVLHVLDPDAWTDALFDAWNAVKGAKSGIILVTEIYPLLAPERCAVPVPSHWLTDMFVTMGFRVAVRHFSIQGSQSYCLAASGPPPSVMSRLELRAVVIDAWRRLRLLNLQAYEGIGPIVRMADQQFLMNAVFGLARASSCLAAIDESVQAEGLASP